MTGAAVPEVAVPEFAVVSGEAVHRSVDGRHAEVLDLVEDAYRRHGEGRTVNPPSYFLRFPDRPSARIIALPASLGGSRPVDGLKWISSVPDNVRHGVPRASAVLILNDVRTGYPYACLEGSIISAVRTAASAALAARRLGADRAAPRRVGFVGCGLIARYLHAYLTATFGEFTEIGVYDLDGTHARRFADRLGGAPPGAVRVHESPRTLIAESDLVVFATTAAEPYLTEPAWFDHHPLVLHISLRDLSPEVILSATNIVDDVDHCLRAGTSLALTRQRTGSADFVGGTLYEVLAGRVRVPADRTVIFSPFGLGVLDLAVGAFAYAEAVRRGDATIIESFFHDLDRHCSPERT